jgi:lipoprotein-releasing system permease protein
VFHLWLVYRFMTSGRRLLNLTSIMSLVGMALGVAALTVAMGVVSGFETSLKAAVTDVFGHILIVRRSDKPQTVEGILSKVKKVAPEVLTYTPFITLEGIIAAPGKLAGVVVQGVDPKTVEQVLHIRSRLIKGTFAFGLKDGNSIALVGKSLAKRFDLKIGQTFKVVLPTPSKSDSTDFTPRVQTYVLGGVLDLGKVEYDERFIVTDLPSAQRLAGVGDFFSGIRVRIQDPEKAPAVAIKIAHELGTQYWTEDWTEVNKNLLEAIKIEKPVIFFVILIMVIAASFNIASNLFVSVLQKYGDISILRAMGFTGKDVTRVFIYQGLFFGFIGTGLGLLLGLLLCLLFVVVQKFVILLPADVYKIDQVGVELRFLDLAAIIGTTVVICLVSTLVPARRGARLDPVEGLRYE